MCCAIVYKFSHGLFICKAARFKHLTNCVQTTTFKKNILACRFYDYKAFCELLFSKDSDHPSSKLCKITTSDIIKLPLALFQLYSLLLTLILKDLVVIPLIIANHNYVNLHSTQGDGLVFRLGSFLVKDIDIM